MKLIGSFQAGWGGKKGEKSTTYGVNWERRKVWYESGLRKFYIKRWARLKREELTKIFKWGPNEKRMNQRLRSGV